MANQCFCNGSLEHGDGPCPYAPVPFNPGRPDLALIQTQLDRGFVHLDVREEEAHIRIQAGLASKRARTTWVVAFQLNAPGRQPISMQKRLHRTLVENEVLSLAFGFRQRFGPDANQKPS